MPPNPLPIPTIDPDVGRKAPVALDLLDCTDTGLVSLSDDGRVILRNRAATDLLGIAEAGPLLTPALSAGERARLLRHLGSPASTPLRLTTEKGVCLTVTTRATPTGRSVSFSPTGYTDAASPFLDALTGLAGRKLFNERLVAILADRPRSAVLLIDLDRFKPVNDVLGHSAGDELLRTVADRLRATLRDADIISRLGGDEFAVALSDCPDVLAIGNRIREVLGRPYLVERQVASIGASIGIAVAPDHGESSVELLRAADLALYGAKKNGRDSVRMFDGELERRARSRYSMAEELRRAIPLQQLELFFQPQVCLETGKLTGMEALVRWRHPERGMVPPDDFIPLAEEMGLIMALGEWVLRDACRQAAGWPGDVSIAVNVSTKQLLDRDRLPRFIAATLAATGLAPSRLEIEITESALLREAESVAVLGAIRELGVRISMDDFGTGYSSLSQLRRFPFDKLKIDRSFVRDLGRSEEAAAVVRAISALGRSLGMSTVAEGVETADQEAICRADGCTAMQGYLVSRPIPAGDIPALFRTFSDRRSSDDA